MSEARKTKHRPRKISPYSKVKPPLLDRGIGARKKHLEKFGHAAKRTVVPSKITPPKPANIFRRRRLFALLDAARRDHRVVWISAPAGSGKTSFAASYVAARKRPVLWYQVDAGDVDVASFFHYLSHAAALAAPRRRRPLPVLSAEFLADLPTFARNYFRAMYARLPPASVIVFDNYQDVPDDAALHELLYTAMIEAPDSLNLLVLSRTEPPAALARLRLCQQAACLDWSTMRLTSDETAGISALRAGGRALGRETLAALHASTYGWVAGLVLLLEQSRAGAVIDAAAVPVGQKLLFDYFATELFARVDPAIQVFLLQTALFPKVSVAAAGALTGMSGSREILDDLARRNYFTVRHAGRGDNVYEYHPLFRGFLQVEAERRYSPDQLRAWRARAAVLLEASGEIEAAAELWRDAEGWDALASHILKHTPAFAAQARFAAPERWLRALPEEVLERTPWLRYWLGVCRMPFDPLEARSHFAHAYTAFQDARDPVGLYSAWTGAVDTFFYLWNDFTQLDFWIDELLALRARQPAELPVSIEARVAYGMSSALLWRQPHNPAIAEWSDRTEALMCLADPTYHAMAGNNLYLYYSWWRGEPVKAGSYIERVKPLGDAANIAPLARLMWHVMEASHCGFSNRIPECRRVVADGLKLAHETGVRLLDFLLHAQAVYGNLFAGDAAGGCSHLEQMVKLMNPQSRLDAAHYHYLSIWVALLGGDLAAAQRHVSPALEHAIACGAPHARAFVELSEAMVKILSGESDAARRLLDAARAWGRDVGNGYVEHHCLLAEAYLHLRAGESESAQACLRPALAMGAAKSYIGPPWIGWLRGILAELYAFALVHEIESDYVRQSIRARRLAPPAAAALLDGWPWPVEIRTLGKFALTVQDKPLSSSGKQQRKPRDLLKLLIAGGERGLPMEQAIDALCPAMSGKGAYKSYAMALHRLRKMIGEDSVLTGDGRVMLNPRSCWVDAWAFEALLAGGLSTAPGSARSSIERAARLYAGPFLSDETGDPAITVFRERLHRKYLEAILTHGRELEARRDFEAALAWYRRGLDLDDLEEKFYQRLLYCCQILGRRAEGIAVYERCRQRLRVALGIAPSAQTDSLRDALLAAR